MNRIATQFTKNAKAYFPIYGQNEKEYMKNLEASIEDYCEAKQIIALEDLYQEYGNPSDVAHAYFSTCDPEYVVKQLKIVKTIKYSILLIITAIFIALSSYCAKLHSEYKIFAEEQTFYEETIIE